MDCTSPALFVRGLRQDWWASVKTPTMNTIELTQAVGETAAPRVSTEYGWKFSGVRRFGTFVAL